MRQAAPVFIAGGLLVLAACDARPPAATEGGAPPPPPPSAPPFAPAANSDSPPAAPAQPVPAASEASDDWRALAEVSDVDRLARYDAAWREALADARNEHRAELAALGPLADPAAGLDRPHPAPGVYRCRTIKLGDRALPGGGRTLAYVAYPTFRCRVDLSPGGDLTLAKQTGSQRSTGQLYPERDGEGRDTNRLIYLGSQAWGDQEASAPGYGRNPERDQIGVLERIGPDRYRLAMPWPRQESKLDLMELQRVGN